MIQEQSKDDFLEAAALIFQRVSESLFKKKNINEITEEEKLNLLVDALKEVKNEYEVNVQVIDKLIDNPKETKELFKELLEQKVKSKEQFIANATQEIKSILPKEILKDFEKVNTTFSKESEVEKVATLEKENSPTTTKEDSLMFDKQSKDLVLLALLNQKYNGDMERIESDFSENRVDVDYIKFNKEENVFELKFTTNDNELGTKDAITEKLSYNEFIQSINENKELVTVLEKHTLTQNESPNVINELPTIENESSEMKIETTIELER